MIQGFGYVLEGISWNHFGGQIQSPGFALKTFTALRDASECTHVHQTGHLLLTTVQCFDLCETDISTKKLNLERKNPNNVRIRMGWTHFPEIGEKGETLSSTAESIYISFPPFSFYFF